MAQTQIGCGSDFVRSLRGIGPGDREVSGIRELSGGGNGDREVSGIRELSGGGKVPGIGVWGWVEVIYGSVG